MLLGGAGAASIEDREDSLAAILTGGHGPAPDFSYTWHQALVAGADGY